MTSNQPDPIPIRKPFSLTLSGRLALRLPLTIMEFPYEVAIAVFSVVAGISSLILYQSIPPALLVLTPLWVAILWALGFIFGGTTILFGLWQGDVSAISTGLRLVAICLATYFLAIVVIGVGVGTPVFMAPASPVALLVLTNAILCAYRSFYLSAKLLILRKLP